MLISKKYEKAMIIISILGNISFYVQALKTFSIKDATSLSLSSNIISFVTISLWLIYGISIKNTPLIVGNSLGFIGSILVIVGIFIY